MNARVWVVVLVGAVGAYIVLAGVRGWAFLDSGTLVGAALGVAVLIIPALGVWLVWREVRVGRQLQTIGRTLAEIGDLPVDDFPRTPSGRVQLPAAQEWFAREKLRVEQDEDDWAGWYRLGLAYDAARDRGRAREAMRESIRLAQASGGPLFR